MAVPGNAPLGAPGGCRHRSRAQGRGRRVACGGRARQGWHEPARCGRCRLLWGRMRTRALRGRGAPAHPAGVRPPRGCGRAVQSDRKARPGRAIGARARKIAAAPRAGLPVPVPGMAAGPGCTARLAPPHAAVRPGAAMQPARPIPPWRHGPAYAQAQGRPPVMPWPIQPPHPTRKGEAHANRGDRATWPDPWPSTLAAQGPCFHRGARPAGGRNG